MSRTAKCRPTGTGSTEGSINGTVVPSADKRLLLEVLKLSKQPHEATYKRRLQAIALLLQHHDQRQIERTAKASVRTVQRWATRARQLGVGALRSRVRRPTSKLNGEQCERLAGELKRPPVSVGYTQPHWTAALLRQHLRERYAATFSLRHCRRLLTTFGVAKRMAAITPSPKRKLVQTTPRVCEEELVVARPLGDYGCKRRALVHIRRLASSGMPLQPFAYTLFDLINEAVPHDEASPGITAVSDASARWIIRDFDYSRWLPQMQKYLLLADPEVSGFRPPSLLPHNPHTVLRHEEIVQPNYYRSEGYNEFFRWMRMHHGLLTLLRDEQANFLGYYPIFRSEKMKPFNRDDVDFLQIAAGDIAQGMRSAGLINLQAADDDTFEAFVQSPQGIVVMNRSGKVISVNRAAQSLFQQFAIYDGAGTESAINGGLSEVFDYIASQLRVIFGNRDDICIEAQQPIVKIYSHCSGATLRLHGFASDLSENGGHFTVLIELGETEQLLRQRIAARYNLSRRQAELLMLLRRGTDNKEIAELLSASRSALKSSLRELRLKLDLGGGSSLREVARLI